MTAPSVSSRSGAGSLPLHQVVRLRCRLLDRHLLEPTAASEKLAGEENTGSKAPNAGQVPQTDRWETGPRGNKRTASATQDFTLGFVHGRSSSHTLFTCFINILNLTLPKALSSN